MTQEHSLSIIVGKPGSGKSTLLENLYPGLMLIKSDGGILTGQHIPNENAFDDVDGIALDEIGHLDQEDCREVERLATVLRKRGKTLILLTQDRAMLGHLPMAHVIDMDCSPPNAGKGAK